MLAEASFRKLWRECFADTPEYEDFYFTSVYTKNTVYQVEDAGMLHLNPYLCQVKKKRMPLFYIVGVGTAREKRRKGIMAALMKQALGELYSHRQPFTYLMPADVRYYEPFSFTAITKKAEYRLPEHNIPDVIDTERLRFATYGELFQCFTEEERQGLFCDIHRRLQDRYAVFAIHNQAYFDLLCKEKQCQGGNVVFCFDGRKDSKHFLGFFAYGVEPGRMYVEQHVFYSNAYNAVQMEYAKRHSLGEVLVVDSFPFMVRVVHARTFMHLFQEDFRDFAEQKKILRVEDFILPENTGWYFFEKRDGGIRITRQGELPENCSYGESVTMSAAGLADYVFNRKGKRQNKVFFAEVV